MVALPEQKNVSELNTGGPLPLIPPGDYKAVAVSSEMKQTSKGDGQYLEIKFVLTEGPYANTEFVERLNILNPSQQAVSIAYDTLGRISKALGMNKTPADSNELHNKPVALAIKTEEGKPWVDKDGVQREGKDKSVIGGYKAVSEVAQVNLVQQPAQAQAISTPAAPEQQAHSAAPAAPATPPWANK